MQHNPNGKSSSAIRAEVVRSADEPHAIAGDRGFDSDELGASGPAPYEFAVHSVLYAELARLIAALPKSERDVVRVRFGLDGREPMTIRASAEVLGISPTAAFEREHRALERLRASLLKQGWQD